MKKNLLYIPISILFLLPLASYAEEVPAETIAKASTTDVVTSKRTFTLCSQEAIEERDTKIAASRSLYNLAMTNALTERKNNEKAAVAIKDIDEKKDAIKASVENYKSQAKLAQTTLTQTRKSVWQAFEDDIKKCRELRDEQDTEETSSDTISKKSELQEIRREAKELRQETRAENKSLKDALKAQFESLRSLFN